MNKIKRDKSIPTWTEVRSKQGEGPSDETTSEDLKEEEFDRMVERSRSYNMEDGVLEME